VDYPIDQLEEELNAGKPETVVAVAARRIEPDAVSRPAVPAAADPRAATQHTVDTRFRPDRVGCDLFQIRAIPILTPFPNIAVHLPQAPVILIKRLDIDRFLAIFAFSAVGIGCRTIEID